ncbi:MAG: urocanate hydratase [Myxococcota bacterium]
MNVEVKNFQAAIKAGIPQEIPEYPKEEPGISHAPARNLILDKSEQKLALRNALRYFPIKHHAKLAPEFARELKEEGRIYMKRYRPAYKMFARPIEHYPAKSREAAAIMLMINNNLDPAIAQHPHELITYGGNGTVFQNWAQYLLTMQYLSEMTDHQTLLLYSGHPMGLFPSSPSSPRVVISNGMVIPNYSSNDDYTRLSALGVTSYGQMTAGSFMYIGPQGIVHGTTITLLNAGRIYLDTNDDLKGKIFISSGLGGMSGAQGKAVKITGGVGILAEINPQAAFKREEQGWIDEVSADLDEVFAKALEHREAKTPLAIAYLGNIVDLWEYAVKHNIKIDLGSDQTSLHIPYSGGYYPAGLSYKEANRMMVTNPEKFKQKVHESLRRQVKAINTMNERGMNFWDYGNAFLLESSRAGAQITDKNGDFIYPSYVENIMGPFCFDYGFGPFRWVCSSGKSEDLKKTDKIAAKVLAAQAENAPTEIKQQINDNLKWIREAGKNKLVVGSQARILYADAEGRISIARAFNRAIKDGVISNNIILGRDHHDVSGTDSPYRETSNIYDGSKFTADMAIQNVIGDAMRSASWVSIHNGGGVGWGEVINGGFGLVLDGTEAKDKQLEAMLFFDVNNGIARRAWAGNKGAVFASKRTQEVNSLFKVTMPNISPDSSLIEETLKDK